MGRQNRQVQRRLGAVAGKGMTDALQISTTTRSKARSTAFIRSSSSRPKGWLIFARGRVESLYTITRERTGNPLALYEIGREEGRESVWPSVQISGVAGKLKKKKI